MSALGWMLRNVFSSGSSPGGVGPAFGPPNRASRERTRAAGGIPASGGDMGAEAADADAADAEAADLGGDVGADGGAAWSAPPARPASSVAGSGSTMAVRGPSPVAGTTSS